MAQGRDDRRHQLEDDGGADVGHDAERADGALQERPAGEHVVEAHHRVARAARLALEELLERVRVDARQRDRGAHARHEEQRQRVEDPGAQLRYLQ
jgi:hypothetical protein